MKSITNIIREKPVYFVCINGINEYESNNLTDCKKFLANFLKDMKINGIKIENTYDYFIGMYNIDID